MYQTEYPFEMPDYKVQENKLLYNIYNKWLKEILISKLF